MGGGVFRHYMIDQQQMWVKWLHGGEYFYNYTYYISIKISPFKALYGYDPLNFTELIFDEGKASKAKYFLQEYHDIMRALKKNLQMAQNCQK